jgi:hypothetical protein
MARQPETSRVQPFPHELVEEYFLAYVLKRTGFSPHIELQQNQVLKGTGFSPYIEVQQNQRALQAAEKLLIFSRRFSSSVFFVDLGLFSRGFLVSSCVWRPFYRPPDTLRPYWARA